MHNLILSFLLRYNIHKNTLWLKTKEARNVPIAIPVPMKTPGGQRVFTDDEEMGFAVHAVSMSTYGFPITCFDLRCIAKSYLDRTGRKVPAFRNNFPGRDWAESFMQRHKDFISQRTAKNITYSRASTDETIINDFFSNLEKEIAGVPPEQIWNYDETNLVDDPGNKKVITRRGCKYPEQIRNSSKACTSLMFCGNAAGNLAPLYINYKAEKIWSTWTENGPNESRYNRTKSGWFDHQVFEDWFLSLMLPILKKQKGVKVLIGDNLSSHINLEVLRQCEENEIKFIALPPNTTHLLQALDVAVFRPLKSHWREILSSWKMTASGSRCSSIPKDEFPGLLKKLMAAMEPNIEKNLKSGFRKTGIFPLNKQQVLSRLPKASLDNNLGDMADLIGESFLEELNKRRQDETKPREKKRRKKLNVPAGRSIGTSDVLNAENNKTEEDLTTCTNKQGKARKQQKRKKSQSDDETDVSDTFSLQDSDETDLDFLREQLSDPDEDDCFEGTSNVNQETFAAEECNNTNFSVGNYVVVNFEGNLFPGKVIEKKVGGYTVSVMERSKKSWKWPSKPDAIFYDAEEVLYSINPPKQISNRGFFQVIGVD